MQVYLRILSYGKAWFKQGALAMLFLLLNNLFSVVSISLIIPFLDILFNTQPAAVTGTGMKADLYRWVDHLVQTYGRMDVLMGLVMVIFALIVLKNLFRYLSSYFMSPLEQGVIQTLRNRLFAHLTDLSMEFYTGNRKGRIINVLVSDVQIVQEGVIGTMQPLLSDPIEMVLILITMLLISWKMTLFTLLILPVTGWVISVLRKSLKRKARKGQEKLGSVISVLEEFLSGIRIVKAFGTEQYEQQRYGRENDEYRGLMVSLKRRSDLASPLTEVLSVAVMCGIIYFGGRLIILGQSDLKASEFITFVAMFGSMLSPLKTFSGALSRIQKGVVSYQRIEEFLETPIVVQNKPDARPYPAFRESIRYEDIRFRYTDETEEVLKGVSLEVLKGQTVALVGPSGSGKSTLADLLPRFYDPTGGRILLDGNDVRDLVAQDLRSKIAMVTQEGILFNDSVLHNIAYGDPKPDRARVEAAARVANAHEFITQLPEGYYTNIGERGAKLSGGQRQRLAIARAVYKNAPILLLDEATSALDSESERLVQDALDRLMQQSTSIVIAHRLSTIRNADRIYVIEAGNVVEWGTHDELLQRGGLYKKLYDIQFREDSVQGG